MGTSNQSRGECFDYLYPISESDATGRSRVCHAVLEQTKQGAANKVLSSLGVTGTIAV